MSIKERQQFTVVVKLSKYSKDLFGREMAGKEVGTFTAEHVFNDRIETWERIFHDDLFILKRL